jgi:hypothetical protein
MFTVLAFAFRIKVFYEHFVFLFVCCKCSAVAKAIVERLFDNKDGNAESGAEMCHHVRSQTRASKPSILNK